ncbi:MAG TPA: hypothetical protein VF730_17415 [Terracidiphilus sp.]
MTSKNISRRELLVGTGAALASAAWPAGASVGVEADSRAGSAQNSGAGAGFGEGQQKPNMGSGRARWMQDPRYCWGVMTHYLADWQARVHNLQMSVDQWNKMVEDFDVEGMAKRLEQAGAGHYQISIGQNSGYYLAPNATYDDIVGEKPSKCSRRDLVADLYDSLHKRDIKLMVYLPSGAPGQDKPACAKLGWERGPYPNQDFQDKWEQVIADWSRRWGDKVEGWWFDGCYWPNTMYRSAHPPNFFTFAAAARAGNSQSAVAFNPGVFTRLIGISPDQDFIAGETNDPEQVNVHYPAEGTVDGVQIHMLCFLGKTWGMGDPRFETEKVIEYTKKIRDFGGGVTWDVPVELDGTIKPAFLEQLEALGKAFPKSSKSAS